MYNPVKDAEELFSELKINEYALIDECINYDT